MFYFIDRDSRDIDPDFAILSKEYHFTTGTDVICPRVQEIQGLMNSNTLPETDGSLIAGGRIVVQGIFHLLI